mmetsp:Transcript_22017/g.35581  ORF Transcript_22017/g.35581 Transcript_22017/m.35581 type:complete len:215 (-) Transcript_22017:102-746(-)
MGCNSTKQADIFQDRQRISREQRQERGHEHESKIAPTAPPRSKPRGIERPAEDDDDDQKTELDNGGKTYGSSYTGNHLLERDFFLQNVLRRDQHKFIDVLSELSTIDEKEAVERVQKYSRIQFDLSHRDSSRSEDRPSKIVDCRAANAGGGTGAASSIENIAEILSERRILNEKVISDFESITDLLILKSGGRGGAAVEPETDEDEKDNITVSW